MSVKQRNDGSVYAGVCIPEDIRRGLAKDIVLHSDNFATTLLAEAIRGPLSDADLEVGEECLEHLEDMAEEIVCGVPEELLHEVADRALESLSDEICNKLLHEVREYLVRAARLHIMAAIRSSQVQVLNKVEDLVFASHDPEGLVRTLTKRLIAHTGSKELNQGFIDMPLASYEAPEVTSDILKACDTLEELQEACKPREELDEDVCGDGDQIKRLIEDLEKASSRKEA